MFKQTRFLSLLTVIVGLALSAWAWNTLPQLESYPIHWNAQGEPDGFASRNVVLFNLLVIPLTALFNHGLFWLLPRIEPLTDNLLKSAKAYNVVWLSVMGLLLIIHVMIARTYIGLNESGETVMTSNILQYAVIGLGGFFAVIGNVMGKVRRNFVFGVKTPWTLTSDLTWDATHRLIARMWVVCGLLVMMSQFFVSAFSGLMLLLVGVGASVVIALVYSYLYWRTAPDKRV